MSRRARQLAIMKTLSVVALCVAAAAARVFDAPLATTVWAGFEIQKGLAPVPTIGPSIEELAKRQRVSGLVVAPDGTCGYISGLSGNAQLSAALAVS
jgi:hypothetical protein